MPGGSFLYHKLQLANRLCYDTMSFFSQLANQLSHVSLQNVTWNGFHFDSDYLSACFVYRCTSVYVYVCLCVSVSVSVCKYVCMYVCAILKLTERLHCISSL